MLVVKPVKAKSKALLDPSGSVWSSIAASSLSLKTTPAGTQPTSYTKVAGKQRGEAAVTSASMRLCHDGQRIYVHLEWKDENEDLATDGNGFPDAAAVLLPLGNDAPINQMGSEQQAVNAWQWRAGDEQGRSVVARGVGTTEPTPDPVEVAAARAGNRWRVVISRSLAGAGSDSVALATGGDSRVGVAIWEGSVGERGGFKAFTENWTDIRLAE
ncbi:MAG: hypothetical protein H8E45_04035 [Proteobacteria bacterium]|nr:hypothetical protein [Pseudomonadota bacterium]